MNIKVVNTVSLGEVLEYEQPTNYIVDNTDYDDEFEIPVLTAGKTFLLGYTNETQNVFSKVPVIIFDDFTTAFKYVDFPFKVKSSAMKILKANNKIADIKFLYYRMMKTGIDTELHKRYWISKYSKVKIPLPPLDQQKKIAAILDAADAYRQKTKALIEKYDELTQSLFLDMFGDTWTNPKKYPLFKLSDLVKEGKIITYGIVQAGEQIENGVPYIRTGDIKNNLIKKNGLLKTSHKIANSYERSKCSSGDIVMSIRATVGTIAFLPPELDGANLTQGTARISPNNNLVSSLYLFHCILSNGIQVKIDRQTKGATFREITLTRLREIELPIPHLDLQTQFAERVQAIEEQKIQAQATLAQAEDLFNSLLQRAFKGELTA